MAYKHPFSRRIESAREFRGLDKQELCALMKFSYETLSRRLRNPDNWKYGELRRLEGILKTKFLVDDE